ncbi:hypothetical protein NDN08_002199 [Rhodosorus marinus]|uniref:C2H2-type domain-containing protein n=1 Tax=Rhodosorus marinus TaxID=101924 RepID=A0AAV8UUG7_9RHOD|nr:hypothetical protein NDN08_002199 [Rhodosorus marinus]
MDPILVKKGVYRCPVKGCSKVSQRKHNVQMHLRRHTKEKPFKCSYEGCTMAYGWKSSLNQHEKLHVRDGDKKVDCGMTLLAHVAEEENLKLPYNSSTLFKLLSNEKESMNLSEVSNESLEKPEDEVEPEFYCEVKVFGDAKPAKLISCPHDACCKLFSYEHDMKIHCKEHIQA